MKYSIRAGTPNDLPEIEILLPRLADFDVPAYRVITSHWATLGTWLQSSM